MTAMRIGFAALYSWRPHVEHLYFLAELARQDGHETFFLTCDGDLPDCYSRELRGRAAWRECGQCRAAGIRSYTSANVDSIGHLANGADAMVKEAAEWSRSSASTLGRFESDADYASAEFQETVDRLKPAVATAHAAALRWIGRNRLDAVCVFNARMDVTRAVFEAARSLDVRVVSLERTWFGDGLQLYPQESCLGLGTVDRLVHEWRDTPLTETQALRAASHVARRILRRNTTEWRAYNVDAVVRAWPVANARHRILLVPSSRNEVWGHADWASQWPEPTAAYDALMERFDLRPEDLVLRCHPNWSERIGAADGRYSESYYEAWAKRRGVFTIASNDKTSTVGLIEQCDAIVVANGSAALEAGFLGKQIIGTAPAFYQEAGLRDSACSAGELASVVLHADLPETERRARATEVARQTLRFCHTMAYRVAQYARFVKAEATTRYVYDRGADPRRFIELLRTGVLQPDDATSSADLDGEGKVLALVARHDWQAICGAPPAGLSTYKPMRRRWLMRPVDLVSRWKSVGDR